MHDLLGLPPFVKFGANPLILTITPADQGAVNWLVSNLPPSLL